MRLLQDDEHGNLNLVEYDDDDKIPPYAILSHTWGLDGQEVTLRDLVEGTGKNKVGFKKIEFCKAQAASDRLQYFWVDTCCIDKSSSAELSKAINSMFRWYQNANKCYVFLSDVPKSANSHDQLSSDMVWKAAFRESKWFTRGWTLQELIAPTSVEFFSRQGDRLGSKKTLEQDIHEITGIAIEALRGKSLADFEVEERFSWAQYRETKHPEDQAYSLLGIFDVFMPLLYAEGREKALTRLREEIDKSKRKFSEPQA
jgi:Heterokaryon incompatibility protein (HET)